MGVVPLDGDGNASLSMQPAMAFRKPVAAQFLGGSAGETPLLSSQSATIVATRRTLSRG
jgi:hypothetical protein